ncbi:MAG TPA: restriction endonuclease subunit S [Leptospiraceae bacterium]|nr:restriction endonuclease subunit S [Leptospiraceae bacterium]HMX56793.1 restriction endonuclease subunit S [Leptospiraceae bacterium]HMZ35146.1 restriction endonuclease subunit S [Leptospiraceae bacterium]HNE21947.1 restriction endonuclease subunit S [Leptospiraceae bacterium]HNJ04194.1 restriction endonuclease subunit S [Leptospiraceae bacterium]
MELKPRYKHTEVGVIPEEWELVKLRSLCPKSAYGPRFSSTLYSAHGNVGTLRTTDMDDSGKISYETIPFAHLDENLFKAHFLEDGAFVVTRSGTCGIAAIFHKIERPVVAGAFLIRFQFNDTVHRSFLKDMLNSTRGRRLTDSLIAGGVQKNLSGTGFLNLKIPLPPFPEQKAIAEALGDVDALIESLEQLIAKKKQIKQGAMQELLTGKRRLPGFSGEWEEKKLGDVCEITTGRKDVNQGNPNGIFPFFTCSRVHTFSDSYSFDTEAILIAGNGDVGNLNYFAGKFEAYQRTYVLREFSVPVSYLWHHLSAFLAPALGLDKVGSSIPYIKRENLIGFTYLSPRLAAESSAIATVLSEMDSEISAVEQKLSKTRAVKQGMMQELLTGRIRLV